jgi:Flp pilus assembly protein TadG
MKSRCVSRISSEEGSALVELGLISVAFVLLLLGVVEVSRMVLVYTTIANAARTGERYAIVHGGSRTGTGVNGPSGPGSYTQVQTVVKNFASAGLLTTSNLTINVNYLDSSNAPGSRISVSVTYHYDPIVRFFSSLLGVTLGSSSEGIIVF